MAILESEVSILMPTYNRQDLIAGAIESAINTNAGEIIISDNNSTDKTVEIIKSYDDPRIKLFIQQNNLGLWPNHLFLIKQASLPYIKFLHSDDRISAGGLSEMCKHFDKNTAILSAISIHYDYDTKKAESEFVLDTVLKFTSEEYTRRICIVGNELGSPNNVLVKKDLIELNEENWTEDVAADQLMNYLLAAKGNVVILPPGPIIEGHHSLQDGRTQRMNLSALTYLNLLRRLNYYKNKKLKVFISIFSFIEGIGIIRSWFGGIRRGNFRSNMAFFYGIRCILHTQPLKLFKNFKLLKAMYQWKYISRQNRNITNIDLQLYE